MSEDFPISSPIPAHLTPPPIPAHLIPVIKTWYLKEQNDGFAPILETELIANGFNIDSEIWTEESGWQEAIDVPELARTKIRLRVNQSILR